MIKDQMTLPLGVDTADIKATAGVLYSASDDEIKAYTIGYVPFTLISESVLLRGLSKGDFVSTSTDLSYTVSETFPVNRGVPFCYSYAASSTAANINAYFDGVNYIDLPWGTTTTTGMIHSYNTDEIVLNNPSSISETSTIHAVFEMFVVYLPDGSTGGASTGSGENGWVTKLAQKTAEIDILDLSFSVTSDIDGSYMPTAVTFTKTDLENADSNGIMKISNGTTTYSGAVYNITVYCAITTAYLTGAAGNLKDGFLQLDNMRYSAPTDAGTPMYTKFPHNTTKTNVFICNGITDGIMIAFPADTYYYIEVSDDSYDYFKWTTYYSDSNNFLSGGFNVADLKILRSIARPVYKISGAFYVAEFNDDFTITGDLIPYANAREWQKNINGDTNEFDPADIPEPGPEDEPDAYGADSIPDLNFSAGAISDFVTMYCLTEQQVSAFGAYLWANIFSEEFVRSIGTILVNDFSINPADILNYIISLRKYPFDLYGKNGYETIASGSLYFGRGVAGIPISGSFGKMQNLAGTFGGEYIEVPAKYNDFRDYEPFTRITVFVPFCGSIELTPSEVVGKRIFITYTVDYSTGNVQADLWVNSDVAFIVGTVTGQIGATVQTTASNNMEVLQKVASTATNFVKVAATIAAAAATGGVAAESAMAGEISGAEATAKELGALSSTVDVTTGALSNAPVVSSNPIHASSVGSGFASFSTPRARLIVERRKYQVPSNYDHVYGKATNVTVTLSGLEGKGFTVCKNVDLSGIPATQDELSAIESLLRSGVYF